ncbi:AAEL003572-PA [Aedes aegypti]|uniref:AAEL003572-PA n=1 Tax=Aedes aegypti TaxID=7159 RepID=Q17F53_AEDAE|nr:AAEL003572-PA [Aedes aegypti]
MLPATGLFRSINCPFFEKDLCTRPFCHFRHLKPGLCCDGPVKKKPKLEYIPMPTILAAKYVPSSKASTPSGNSQNKVNGPPTESKPEQLEPEVDLENEAPKEELTNGQNGKEQKHDDEGPVAKENSIKPKELEEITKDVDREIKENKRKITEKEKSNSSSSSHRKTSHESDKHRKNSRDEKDNRKEKSYRKESEYKFSSSSTSERKHSASSSSHKSDDKHRTKSDREKEREKDRSKSKHKDSSKDKEKRLDKEKERTKSSSSKDREHDRKKSSDKDRSRSSHSSSKSSSKSSSTHSKHSSSSSSKSKTSGTTTKPSSSSTSKPKVELADEIYRDLLDNPPSDIDIDSDEDEVMRQCRMIFEEYEDEPPPPAPAPTASKVASKKKPDPKSSNSGDVELIDMFAEKFYDENRKKRVAHESGSNVNPSNAQPPAAKRTNHVQEAMRSVYHRQEIVRKQQEELAAKQRFEEENRKRIEDETRKAMNKPVTPRLSNGSPRSPVLSRFTPAVNVLAFQKAKEKIEQLRKMKGIGTPAQTAPKGSGRVAHIVSTVTSPATSTSAATSTPLPPPPKSTKISFNIRMQFYNLMIKHCLNIYPSCDDAYDRAQTEELAVMKKCSTPMIYKSSALLTINKLRKEAVDSGSETTEKSKTISHDVILAGKMGQNISWSVNKKLKTEVKSAYTIDNAPSTVAYKMIYECILTEEQLQANGFPRSTDTPGKAKIHTPKPSRPPNEEERYCSRCSKVFNLETYEEPAVDSCNYHAKSTCYRRGFADNLHSCCQQPAGTAGCMYANYHVSSFVDYDDLTGFVKTMEPAEGYVPSKKDIFALDCEMCYTTGGLELTRVTVVDINEKTVYDALVKPTNKVIDYNTRFSGITEQMLKNTTTNLHNVQAVLLSMFNSETILVGHSLESDFKALKLIHDVVVDTSVLYPHKMGPPKKRALKTLCIENLKKIIQENDNGHDSAEDSVVCIQLIKHYLRNRII